MDLRTLHRRLRYFDIFFKDGPVKIDHVMKAVTIYLTSSRFPKYIIGRKEVGAGPELRIPFFHLSKPNPKFKWRLIP